MTCHEPHLKLCMRSDPMYLAGVRAMVSTIARRIGFDDAACGKIALAIDEALSNVMKHGYDRCDDRPIWVSVWPQDEQSVPALRVVIEDEGRQVEPAAIRGRDLDDVRPGGLGVHIIREVMDHVQYEKRPDAGMRLTLVKRVVTAPATPGAKEDC